MYEEKEYSGSELSVSKLVKHSIEGNNKRFSNLRLNNETDIGQVSNVVSQTSAMQTTMQNEQKALLSPEVKPPEQSAVGVASETNQRAGSVESEANKTKQSEKSGSLLKLTLEKLKANKGFGEKNNKIVVGVVVLAVILVLGVNVFSQLDGASGNNKSDTTTFNSLEYVSSSLYVKNLETKLVQVFSQIKGVGQVSVMITLESGPELKIATSVDERKNTTTGSATSTTSVTVVENPIIITKNGQSTPLVLMEIMPVIKGIIIVAQGANSPMIRLQLLEAVQSLLEINGKNIQIYSGI